MSYSKIIKQSFQVSFNFNLIFTSKIFKVDNHILLDLISNHSTIKSKAIVVVDNGVSKAHPQLKESIINYFKQYNNAIQLNGPILEIPGGEQSKNNEHYIKLILEKVNNFNIDRHSYIIAIGGGAVLDMVGFAAAIAHRGVRLIRIPTTVLSQNDSGIGVKNGINYFGKKNFVGSFAVPYAVINDDSFLSTLDERDWRSGISEALKVSLIKDYNFFQWIENHIKALNSRDKNVMNELIYRCADLHMKHIQNSGDAFEQGSSRPLDFGHWAAHKLEQLSNYEIRHGEAVAIGIALDSTYSHLKGYLSKPELIRILDCIINLGFNISYNQMTDEIIKGLEEFREHLGGKLTIMLLKSLGTGFEVHQMDENLVLASIGYMNEFSSEKITL
ncbi:3-dehydroquinate synthase [Tamlana sp. 2201CG12-4]|uniref:3-dehydroquinate synthase n=1 Tax=Tamlana sp. 2201CG12-4 TaxID=3112582 RepID=UPI002DB8AAE4|nr:3-dehydroquinate synthase [Tamlana sp. 2201CG12-4]MEC3905673.1 3-dehydroquinate synthase [Tamlana sp. 2201CG12-4]